MAEAREHRKREARERAPLPSEDSGSGLIPDLLRRGLALGFSGFFLTEEAVRKAFGDTVPKDWVDFVTDQSERTRSELIERLAGELARSLESLDLVGLFDSLMAGRTIEVKAEIRLAERPADARPGRPSVRLRAADRGKQTR